MRSKAVRVVLALVVTVGLCACGGSAYYRVKDIDTNNVYYTDELESLDSGAVTLKDANSGGMVTLQDSEVIEINKEEFLANTKKE